MRTTVNLDESLVEEARRLSGLDQRSALLDEALAALIQRESARRLARLGGTERALKPVPRQCSPAPDPAPKPVGLKRRRPLTIEDIEKAIAAGRA